MYEHVYVCVCKIVGTFVDYTVLVCFMIIRVEFTFTAYLNGTELINAIENINYKGGNTRTGAGLKYIADNFFNPASIRDVPKVSWLL